MTTTDSDAPGGAPVSAQDSAPAPAALPIETPSTEPDSMCDGISKIKMADMQPTVTAGKKRKSKAMASRGPTALPKSRGSGFEPFYAEPPLTVEEFEEESDLYHITLPFDERIETCIQRYRARRRMDNDRTNLFNRYLTVGGVDCTPRQFNGTMGLDKDESAGLTASEKKVLGATDVVNQGGSALSKFYATDNKELWAVDFSGVAAGFFSMTLREIGCSRRTLMRVGIDVVDNFLRYIQLHDTCPEFSEDIKAARAICTQAHTELPNCLDVLQRMPGQFNRVCAKLFWRETDSTLYHEGIDPLRWAVDPEGNEMVDVMDDTEDINTVFRNTLMLQKDTVSAAAIAAAAKDGDLSKIHIVSTQVLDLEIVSLEMPTDELREQYAATHDKLRPAGTVVCKHYCIEEGIANQARLSQEQLDELDARHGKPAFFLDATAMDMLAVGMKLRVVMHQLSCDLAFVSAVKEVHPSFYLFLPQQLMLDFKEPQPNEREAPSVDKPDADEEAAADDGKDE